MVPGNSVMVGVVVVGVRVVVGVGVGVGVEGRLTFSIALGQRSCSCLCPNRPRHANGNPKHPPHPARPDTSHRISTSTPHKTKQTHQVSVPRGCGRTHAPLLPTLVLPCLASAGQVDINPSYFGVKPADLNVHAAAAREDTRPIPSKPVGHIRGSTGMQGGHKVRNGRGAGGGKGWSGSRCVISTIFLCRCVMMMWWWC